MRARSIVADILSMGVAERNLGTAIQLVSGHLGRQIAQWLASPFGMATIAVAGITLINSAIEAHKQKLRETAQEASNQAKKSAFRCYLNCSLFSMICGLFSKIYFRTKR